MDTPKVRYCLVKAEENRKRAGEADDAQAKETFETVAKKWLALAESYRSVEAPDEWVRAGSPPPV